jgi:hypothetical protein
MLQRTAPPKRRSTPRRNEASASHVYVIEAEPDVVKIGIASNPKSRLNGLATGASQKLTLIGSVKVGRGRAFAIEKIAHDLLAPLRMRGEWFACPSENAWLILQLIASDYPRTEDAYILVQEAMIGRRYSSLHQEISRLNPRWKKERRAEILAEMDALDEVIAANSRERWRFGVLHGAYDEWRLIETSATGMED